MQDDAVGEGVFRFVIDAANALKPVWKNANSSIPRSAIVRKTAELFNADLTSKVRNGRSWCAYAWNNLEGDSDAN